MTPRRRPSLFLFAFCTIVSATSLAQDYSSQFLQAHGELNDVCRTAKECRSFGYVCRNNQTCDCDEMYKADLYKKKCVGGVDQKCVYDEHCIEGAYCMNQETCRCKDSTPFVLDEGMVCAKSNIHNTAFVSFFYLILVFVALVF